jgi:hypothetical protein
MQDGAAFVKVTIVVYSTYQHEAQGTLVGDRCLTNLRVSPFASFDMYCKLLCKTDTVCIIQSRSRAPSLPEPARQTGGVLPPARQAERIAPRRFGVHEVEQRVGHLACHPRLRYLLVSRPPRHRFSTDFKLDLRVLSYGYRRYLCPQVADVPALFCITVINQRKCLLYSTIDL